METKNKQWLEKFLIFLIFITFSGIANSQADWKNDFKFQQLKNRPDLEVRYSNGDRDAFEIVAADYQLTGNLLPPNLLYESNTSVPWLWFEMTDQKGDLYSTKNSKTKSRINLYRRGPYFCEIHWLDIRFANHSLIL